LEDKIVQKAMVEVLNAIYEQDFLDCSYGFRPGRGQHQALDEVKRVICTRCIPDSSPLPWPSPESEWFGSPCSVCRRCRIPFMVRTAISHLFLRGILQLSHFRSPGA